MNRVHVVVAAIFNEQGQVLLARRHPQAHLGGLWEFPGGKVEPTEGVQAALARELEEELGLVPDQSRPLIRIQHDYPDKSVLLDVWRVDRFSGLDDVYQTVGREGQPLCWVSLNELPHYELPAANQAIVHALRLPYRYLITPEPGDDTARFLQQLQQSLQSGVRQLRLRAWDLGAQAYQRLAQQVLTLCRAYQARCLFSGDLAWVVDLLTELEADGLHLSSSQLLGLRQRPVAADVWLAASCHDAREVSQAGDLGVDFITLSPLLPTRSHPQAKPLGWSRFQRLAESATMPVYGMGGLVNDQIELVWQRGGQGIAAISSLWGDPDAALDQ